METNTQLSDKKIIIEQKKTIRVLQAENIRLTAELRKTKKQVKSSRIEMISKKM